MTERVNKDLQPGSFRSILSRLAPSLDFPSRIPLTIYLMISSALNQQMDRASFRGRIVIGRFALVSFQQYESAALCVVPNRYSSEKMRQFILPSSCCRDRKSSSNSFLFSAWSILLTVAYKGNWSCVSAIQKHMTSRCFQPMEVNIS